MCKRLYNTGPGIDIMALIQIKPSTKHMIYFKNTFHLVLNSKIYGVNEGWIC